MVRQKQLELSAGAQVDNVIYLKAKEAEKTVEAKKILNLKQCGVTKNCLSSGRANPYGCESFDRCDNFKELLKLFI